MNWVTGEVILWVVFALCLLLSFIFSGMEAGVFALNRLRIRQLMRAGGSSARVLYNFLENPENFLWTILVGNTLVNFFIIGWLVAQLHDAVGQYQLPFIGVLSVAVFLFYTFFDLLPKMVFRMFPNRLCLALARPFRLIHWILRPLVAVVEAFSRILLRWRGGKVFTGHLFGNREELRLVMQESGQAFSSEERMMINRVLNLQNLTVRQVMLPLPQAVALTVESPVGKVLELCRERRIARLPVWEKREGVDRIMGVVALSTVLYQPTLDPTRPVADYVRPALFVDENLRLEVALRRMQRGGHRIAIVLSRERKEVGILTLQDVLKSIFGEVSL